MDPHNISQLADDTAIIAENFVSLTRNMTAVIEYSKDKYQIPNTKKTFYCNFNRTPVTTPIILPDDTKICSVNMNKGHKYLGMLYYPTNDLQKIIKKISINVWFQFQNIMLG